jgi:hypothetical protein
MDIDKRINRILKQRSIGKISLFRKITLSRLFRKITFWVSQILPAERTPGSRGLYTKAKLRKEVKYLFDRSAFKADLFQGTVQPHDMLSSGKPQLYLSCGTMNPQEAKAYIKRVREEFNKYEEYQADRAALRGDSGESV